MKRIGLTLGLTWAAGIAVGMIGIQILNAQELYSGQAPEDQCCKPDATSPTGASEICVFGGTTIRLPCADDDHDGLLDTYEDQLLIKFAPKIWLHPDENRAPVNVDWLISRSRMRYSHARCSDHQLIASGLVTRSNITQQAHRNAKDPLNNWPWNWCEHYDPINRSNRYTASPKKSFFLQFRDSAHVGSSNQSDWVIYGHVFPATNDRIMIQYWQLYAFNDSFASANHEGDWEYTGVLVDRQENPQRVVHFRHGRIVDVPVSRAEWEGSHHVSYVAKGGHAQYRSFVRGDDCVCEGWRDCLQGFADNCAAGIAWNTWESKFGGIVNVGEKRRPLNNSNWLRYSGLWGEIGNAADVVKFTSGPQGPAYQVKNWRWPN